MKVSRHERALRAELEDMEACRETMAASVANQVSELDSMDAQIDLLQRILEAGRTDDKGGEGDG